MDPDAVLRFCFTLILVIVPVGLWVLYRFYVRLRSGGLNPKRFGDPAANRSAAINWLGYIVGRNRVFHRIGQDETLVLTSSAVGSSASAAVDSTVR